MGLKNDPYYYTVTQLQLYTEEFPGDPANSRQNGIIFAYVWFWKLYCLCSLHLLYVSVLLSFHHLSSLSTLRRSTEDWKMNNTLSNTSIKCVRDTSVTAVVFPCLYSILFIVALILNSLAAWIFFSIPSTSTFVVYLKNVVRHEGFCFINFVVSAEPKKLLH